MPSVRIATTVFIAMLAGLFCLGPSAQLCATPIFALDNSALGNISRADVISTMTAAYERNDPLFSAVDGIAVQHGFDGRDNCLVYATLDRAMSKFTLFHYEADLAEYHFLYSGGQPGNGQREFNEPSDIALWGIHYTYSAKILANYFLYHIFVADTYNNRVQHLKYYTHGYDAQGARVADQLEYANPIGSGLLAFPTSVDMAGWGTDTWLVVADAGGLRIRIFNGSYELIRTIAAPDLGLAIFQPLALACLEAPDAGDLYIAVALGDGNMQPSASGDVVVLHVQGSSVSVISQVSFQHKVRDVAASAPMQFAVLDEQMNLYQLSSSGQQLSEYGLTSLNIPTSQAKCIAASQYDLACGLDYDDDSGIALLRFAGGCVDVSPARDHFFPAFEPISIHYKVLEPGNYAVALCRYLDDSMYLNLPDAPIQVGEHDYDITHVPSQNNIRLRIRIRQTYTGGATRDYYSDMFRLNICPVISIEEPCDGMTLCYGAKPNVIFSLEYPDISAVQKVSILCRRHNTDVIDKTKDMYGLVQGVNQSYMTMPSVVPCYYDVAFRGVMNSGMYSEYLMDGAIYVHSCGDTLPPPPDVAGALPISQRDIDSRIAEAGAIAVLDQASATTCLLAKSASGRMATMYDLRGRQVAREVMQVVAGDLSVARFRHGRIGAGVYYARIAGGNWPAVKITILK